MTEETKTTEVVTSPVTVNLPVAPVVSKTVVVARLISAMMIAKDIASRVTGKILLGVEDLFDPKTGTFLPEADLKAKGAIFITTAYDKVLTFASGDTVKKGRTTKEPVPYIQAKMVMQWIANADWSNYINRRNDDDYTFTANRNRANGVTNFENCKAIGETKKGFHTINGIAFRVLEEKRYYNEKGIEYTPEQVAFLKTEYLKVQSKASKQKEADKHGIAVEIDPKYRTVRIDNCSSVRCFGFDYQPTDHYTHTKS